jgi:hypothetical protein
MAFDAFPDQSITGTTYLYSKGGDGVDSEEGLLLTCSCSLSRWPGSLRPDWPRCPTIGFIACSMPWCGDHISV